MFTKRILSAAIPFAALALAFGPTAASADVGGPVVVSSPNASSSGGVEVAGVVSSGGVFSCAFTTETASVQTCVLPAGLAPAAPMAAAPGAGADGIAVAGIQAGPGGQASFTCVFSSTASGPQTCVIGG